jgi:ATP-binding cassette subfamily B protein
LANNYFAVLAPEITGFIVGKVQQQLPGAQPLKRKETYQAPVQWLINQFSEANFESLVIVCSLTILALALIRGILMFFMRQTLIVMSRHIEYDLKNAVFQHYQQLDASFFKVNSTGDLMNRIAEDISRVRMYVGPAIMYLTNLTALVAFCIINMYSKSKHLTLIVIAPLPILALTIYIVNTLIHKKSEHVQALLSTLTSSAQEAYSGIRVIKSFVQENSILSFFKKNSESYRNNALSLSKVEAVYFPSMTLMIGLSILLTVFLGGKMAIEHPNRTGLIVEFVIYINMLTFPVSAIGWVASMIQRAAASQKRINEFLLHKPTILNKENAFYLKPLKGHKISLDNISFTYANTGIKAISKLNLQIEKGEKIMILGATGSGKTTLAHLVMRQYEADIGKVSIDGEDVRNLNITSLRKAISYVPQDVFLFSDSVHNNISFGAESNTDRSDIIEKAKVSMIHNEIERLDRGYDTIIGERGVTLSGGQKQRISIARALMKDAGLVILDDCLSAVDTKTEYQIISNLASVLKEKTVLIITHRIFTTMQFDKIIVMDGGSIVEQGTHDLLIRAGGSYAALHAYQTASEKIQATDWSLQQK